MRTRRLLWWVATLVVLGVLVALGVKVFTGDDDGTKLTAYFSRTTGLYVGDDVRVLGVRVGEVDSITPGPKHVTVSFTIDHGVDVPAKVKAAIVAPNLVTGRFVQLAPAYRSGPRLPGGSVIKDTAVPIEFDDVKLQLTRLAKSLAPTATDRKGALAGVVNTSDANLTGSAEQLRTMLHNLSLASDTLASSRGDLFGTVRGLQIFVHSLVKSDASVRSFSAELKGASGVLNDNRQELGSALSDLDVAVAKVGAFLKQNRGSTKASIRDLATLTSTLAAKKYQVAELLHVAPTALSNFYNIIDPRYAAATGTLSIGNFDNMAQLICRQIVQTGGTVKDCEALLNPLLKQVGLSKLPTSLGDGLNASPLKSTPAVQAPTSDPTPPQTTPLKVTKNMTALVGLLLPGGGT
jgi:phospholipid/cholesterol/gamma-HCH transport system substrate-binding protein